MDRHDQTILNRRARHRVQHVRFEDVAVLGRSLTTPRPPEQPFGLGPVQFESQDVRTP
jgi:hypothetical protein